MNGFVILNLIAFQVGWWSTMLLASNGQPVWAALPGVVVFVLHAVLRKAHPVRTISLLMAAGLGYLADQIMSLTGVLGFAPALLPAGWAPLWVLGLWLGFVTTLDGVFAFLKSSHAFAAVAGAVSGPLAYAAGTALGVNTVSGVVGYLILAAAWAGALFISVAIVRAAEALSPTAVAPDARLRQERMA